MCEFVLSVDLQILSFQSLKKIDIPISAIRGCYLLKFVCKANYIQWILSIWYLNIWISLIESQDSMNKIREEQYMHWNFDTKNSNLLVASTIRGTNFIFSLYLWFTTILKKDPKLGFIFFYHGWSFVACDLVNLCKRRM